MKYPNKSLVLASLQVTPYDTRSVFANKFPAVELFDNRHDFSINYTQKALAVLMTFHNERYLYSDESKGIRRTVTLFLLDITANCVLENMTARINIPKDYFIDKRRVDIPFAYSDINVEHSYKVIVRDDSTKHILGEKVFNLFDEQACGNHPASWYKVEKGGISPDNEYQLFKSVEARDYSYNRVRFFLKPQFKEMPAIMPEMEIRIYYPDGSIDDGFFVPECCDSFFNEYFVAKPFLATPSTKGICYAEILCMDYPVAGFVFSTQGPWEYNFWEGDELECLEEYSLKAAVDRFQSYFAIDIQEPEEAEIDEELDQLLNKFIATEIGMEDFDPSTVSDEDDEITPSTESEDNNETTTSTISEEDDDKPSTEKTTDNSVAMPESEEKSKADKPTTDKYNKLTEALSGLVGLREVKEKLAVYERLVNFNLLRSINGLPIASTPLHSMFLGSPGTGKTTVAKMLGQMLADVGVLSKGHLVIRERATLLGPNYSNEETNTLNAIEEAQGGILLIDEAYQLCQPNDPRDPGKFVIEALMTALADESKRDWMLILAGYPDEMKRMFDINPGFKSRIPEANIYNFEDFNESELMEIAERYLSKHKYELTEEAHNKLKSRLSIDYSQKDKKFGNARHVINIIQTEILPTMAVRVTSDGCKTPKALSLIEAEDIQDFRMDIAPSHNRIGFIA